MSDPLLGKLDLARHARMLRRALGRAGALAVCNREGEVVWADEPAGSREIHELLRELRPELDELPDARSAPETVDLGAGRQLTHVPFLGASAEPEGRLLALVERDPAPRDLDACLLDAAASISGELRMHQEIESLAGDLTSRHEELNLVYSLEGQARAFDQGDVGGQALLMDFAESLDVCIAAFVTADRAEPLSAQRGATFPNLDLVLTALRCQIFPFIALHRKALILNEPEDVRREYFFVNMPYRMLACPVENGGRVEAMMALVRREDQSFFTNGDRNLASVVASQMALILRNQCLVSDLRRFGDQLAEALIQAVEAKDPYTRGHSERVKEIATRIGSAAGLLGGDVEDIAWGALLHDVGKIGIPDRILCKAGRLTQEEYTLVQVHPERSYEILRHIEHLGRNAIDAARYHQEQFDGGGYPHGLAGNQIPLHARVTAVADTYDAITSSRAYRPGSSHEKAMSVISEVAGSQLDPEYVRIFERLCGDDSRWLKQLTRPFDPPDE